MPALKLDVHRTTAQALFEQRALYLNQPLIEGQLFLTVESDMMRHLQVLVHCQDNWPEPQTPGDIFLMALGQPEDGFDREWLVAALCKPGPHQQALCDALCWRPGLLATSDLVALYQQKAELRPLLFDLWRHRRDHIPAGLMSTAELRGKNIQLQTAALRYAASRIDIGHKLFLPYFRELNNAASAPQIPGKLMATALWGSLLRGTGQVYETLWRAIEREHDAKSLYRLLRIGALIATPELPAIIRQYAKGNPAKAAELLALHGTKSAIDTLANLTPTPDAETDFQAAWLWISGQHLHVAPRLEVIGADKERKLPEALDWWQQRRDCFNAEQRLLFGQPLNLELVKAQACQWGGRYSLNLLDLLAFLQKEPIPATERISLRQRQRLLAQAGRKK